MFRQITQSRLLKDVIIIAIIFIIYHALVSLNYIPVSVQGLVSAFLAVIKSILQLVFTMFCDILELIGSVFVR